MTAAEPKALLTCYLIGVNVLALLLYGWDKYRSKLRGARRVPERTLLLIAVMGGSVGALMGMRVFRHKTRHRKFRFGLPAILAVQLALAVWLGAKG